MPRPLVPLNRLWLCLHLPELAPTAQALRLAHQPEREAQSLHCLALALGALTPHIVLEPPDLLLDISASLRLFGGLRPIMRRAQQISTDCGQRSRLGLAATPLAARLLAHAGQRHGQRRSRCIRLHHTRRLLRSLPLAVLGEVPLPGPPLPMAALTLLHDLGARRLGDLADLPRAGLRRRDMAAWLDALDRALGQQPDPKAWFEPPASFDAQYELAWPLDAAPALLSAAEPLLQALCGWLTQRWLAAQVLTLTLRHEQGQRRHQPDDVLRLELATPSRDLAQLRRLLNERLQRLPLSAPVDTLALHLDLAVPDSGQPLSWLPDDPAQAHIAWGSLIDRLRARLGPARIQRLSAHDDARPEWADQASPANNPQRKTRPTTLRADPTRPRPGWLLPTPRALTEANGHPMLAGQRLILLGRPERIETGWHDGSLARRDYYVAASADGVLHWIYRDRSSPMTEPTRWFLHGVFG